MVSPSSDASDPTAGPDPEPGELGASSAAPELGDESTPVGASSPVETGVSCVRLTFTGLSCAGLSFAGASVEGLAGSSGGLASGSGVGRNSISGTPVRLGALRSTAALVATTPRTRRATIANLMGFVS